MIQNCFHLVVLEAAHVSFFDCVCVCACDISREEGKILEHLRVCKSWGMEPSGKTWDTEISTWSYHGS